MLRIFFGPDTYSRAEAVAGLKAELDSDGMLSVNTVSFEGAQLDLPTLLATCDTVPFLAPHRLVIVTDLLVRAQSAATRGRAPRRSRSEVEAGPAFGELVEYVPRMSPSTTLLLLDGTILGENALLQALRPFGEVRMFPQLSEQQLMTWVDRRARALGASFDPRAARLLVQSLRGDLWALAGEVEKLALYAAGRPVTDLDVRTLVAAAQESNIFALVDAVVEGRVSQALQQLDLLLHHGEAGPYLITMIARQYRQLIVAEDLVRAGAAPAAIMQATEVRSDTALRRILQKARRLDALILQRQFERILDADLAIKRGEGDEAVVLQMLVAELAGGLASRAQPPSRYPAVSRGRR